MLADDLQGKFVFQIQKAVGFVFLQPRQRHAGHLADHLRNNILGHHAVEFLRTALPFLLFFILLPRARFSLVAELGSAFVVRVLDCLVFLHDQVLDFLFEFSEVQRLGHVPQANARPGLVDDVDALVRLNAAGDVAA